MLHCNDCCTFLKSSSTDGIIHPFFVGNEYIIVIGINTKKQYFVTLVKSLTYNKNSMGPNILGSWVCANLLTAEYCVTAQD